MQQFRTPSRTYPMQHCRLIKAQNAIGWKNFLEGRWSLQWRKLQQQHHAEHPAPPNPHNKKLNTNDPRTWATKTINTMWDLWFDMWNARNRTRHGHDQESRRQADREQVHQEIEQLCNMRDDVPLQHRFIFRTPLHEIKQKKTYQIRNWMSTWKSLMIEDRA